MARAGRAHREHSGWSTPDTHAHTPTNTHKSTYRGVAMLGVHVRNIPASFRALLLPVPMIGEAAPQQQEVSPSESRL